MDVACSTFCFGEDSLEQALRRIAELEFTRVDLGVGSDGPHLRPHEVLEDSAGVLTRIRRGPTIGISGVTARLNSVGERFVSEIDAVAHLAKQLATAILTVDAGPAGTEIADECQRLQPCLRACERHGVTLCLLTKTGTLAETPAVAVDLCKRLPGLGVALDPSYYICGRAEDLDWDGVYPFVRHVFLRDTGRDAAKFQTPVGRGVIDYSKIVISLGQQGYRGALVVDFEPQFGGDLDPQAESRRLGRVLESIL
jgi:sugar phosphate isomerase/epimerase